MITRTLHTADIAGLTTREIFYAINTEADPQKRLARILKTLRDIPGMLDRLKKIHMRLFAKLNEMYLEFNQPTFEPDLTNMPNSIADVLNAYSSSDGTTLMPAAKKGYSDVVHALLEAKASPHRFNTVNGESPLRSAVSRGHIETVKTLLAAKADIPPAEFNVYQAEGITRDYESCIRDAKENNHAEILELLLATRSSRKQEMKPMGDLKVEHKDPQPEPEAFISVKTSPACDSLPILLELASAPENEQTSTTSVVMKSLTDKSPQENKTVQAEISQPASAVTLPAPLETHPETKASLEPNPEGIPLCLIDRLPEEKELSTEEIATTFDAIAGRSDASTLTEEAQAALATHELVGRATAPDWKTTSALRSRL